MPCQAAAACRGRPTNGDNAVPRERRGSVHVDRGTAATESPQELFETLFTPGVPGDLVSLNVW